MSKHDGVVITVVMRVGRDEKGDPESGNLTHFSGLRREFGGEIGGKCGSSSSGSVKHLIHQRMTAVVNHLI